MEIYLGIIILLTLSLGILMWVVITGKRQQENALQKALESTQKRLDYQTAQINIFTKALPNIQMLVSEGGIEETWKSTSLDEIRAMVRADGASFWRFNEQSGELIRDLVRGKETDPHNKVTKVPLGHGDLGQAAKMKTLIVKPHSPDLPGQPHVLIIPLVVGENLRGVYRLVRTGSENVSSREADLVRVFVQQMAVSLENKELVNNREKFYLELVQTLADLLDSRDATKEGQTQLIRQLARSTAKELEMPEEFIYYLEFAALMHDIGKIAIDEKLLKKPGKLTEEEMAIVRKHPELGYKILAPVTMLAPVAPMVLYHQEWFNGKGYPEGLRGEEIPLGARIVSILDAWGSMTSDRPWRKALTPHMALKEIRKCAGTQFDPRVVDAFAVAVEKRGLSEEKVA